MNISRSSARKGTNNLPVQTGDLEEYMYILFKLIIEQYYMNIRKVVRKLENIQKPIKLKKDQGN